MRTAAYPSFTPSSFRYPRAIEPGPVIVTFQRFQASPRSVTVPSVTTRSRQREVFFACIQAVGLLSFAASAMATPANKAALEKHYDKFLAKNLARCTTCHLPSDNKNPESLDEFPPLRPAFRGMREGQGLKGGAAAVQNDRVMMILGPIETGEVGQLFKRAHSIVLSLHRRPAGRLADIRTLMG